MILVLVFCFYCWQKLTVFPLWFEIKQTVIKNRFPICVALWHNALRSGHLQRKPAWNKPKCEAGQNYKHHYTLTSYAMRQWSIFNWIHQFYVVCGRMLLYCSTSIILLWFLSSLCLLLGGVCPLCNIKHLCCGCFKTYCNFLTHSMIYYCCC